MGESQRILGMSDAADYLELSVQRVKQLAAEGRIGEMIAGRYLFSRAELAAFKRRKRPSHRPKGT